LAFFIFIFWLCVSVFFSLSPFFSLYGENRCDPLLLLHLNRNVFFIEFFSFWIYCKIKVKRLNFSWLGKKLISLNFKADYKKYMDFGDKCLAPFLVCVVLARPFGALCSFWLAWQFFMWLLWIFRYCWGLFLILNITILFFSLGNLLTLLPPRLRNSTRRELPKDREWFRITGYFYIFLAPFFDHYSSLFSDAPKISEELANTVAEQLTKDLLSMENAAGREFHEIDDKVKAALPMHLCPQLKDNKRLTGSYFFVLFFKIVFSGHLGQA